MHAGDHPHDVERARVVERERRRGEVLRDPAEHLEHRPLLLVVIGERHRQRGPSRSSCAVWVRRGTGRAAEGMLDQAQLEEARVGTECARRRARCRASRAAPRPRATRGRSPPRAREHVDLLVPRARRPGSTVSLRSSRSQSMCQCGVRAAAPARSTKARSWRRISGSRRPRSGRRRARSAGRASGCRGPCLHDGEHRARASRAAAPATATSRYLSKASSSSSRRIRISKGSFFFVRSRSYGWGGRHRHGPGSPEVDAEDVDPRAAPPARAGAGARGS